jgi:preprotein translocase subunit SecA
MMGAGTMRQFERYILLQIIDNQWKDHLLGMDYLKEGIGLRGYGQRDPLVEYKKESFDMFQAMLDRIEDETIRYLYLLQPVVEPEMTRRPERPAYRQGPPPPAGGGPKTSARAMIPKKRKK